MRRVADVAQFKQGVKNEIHTLNPFTFDTITKNEGESSIAKIVGNFSLRTYLYENWNMKAWYKVINFNFDVPPEIFDYEICKNCIYV